MNQHKYILRLLMVACVSLIIACSNGDHPTAQDPITKNINDFDAPLLASNIPAYLDQFQEQLKRRAFLFNGQGYQVFFVEPDIENNQAVLGFDLGLIIVGFDYARRVPTGDISIHLGSLDDLMALKNQPDARLVKEQVSFTNRLTHDYIFSGTMRDMATQGIYQLYFVMNPSYLFEGDAQVEDFGSVAVISGTLGTSTYIQLKRIIDENPALTTLVLQDISGSSDDRINVHTGRLVRTSNLTTYVPADGVIASGGVDLFLAGTTRLYERGGEVAVHSWCCINGMSAHLAAADAPEHANTLAYTQEMLGMDDGESFYRFTLQAAAFEDIHIMTEAELLEHLVDGIIIP